MDQPAPSLLRNALIPFSLVMSFVLVYVLEAPAWSLLPLGLATTMLYLAVPTLGARAIARFDREAVELLSSERADLLRARWQRAWLLRLFAPPASRAERAGLVAAHNGAWDRALEAYQRAAAGYPPGRAPLAVKLGLAHASHALARDEEAIRLYDEILQSSGALPRLTINLAHSLARSGTDLGRAQELADAVLQQSSEPDALLVRALVHARRGQRSAAKRLCKKAGKQASASLRDEVDEALQKRKKG